jgi:hypothetical protein
MSTHSGSLFAVLHDAAGRFWRSPREKRHQVATPDIRQIHRELRTICGKPTASSTCSRDGRAKNDIHFWKIELLAKARRFGSSYPCLHHQTAVRADGSVRFQMPDNPFEHPAPVERRRERVGKRIRGRKMRGMHQAPLINRKTGDLLGTEKRMSSALAHIIRCAVGR